MIREDLLEFQYYLDRLSKFMQESYGICGQVETFWSLLKQVNDYYDEFFKKLNFFSEDPEGDMLDKIGAIFGCRRNFTIPIYNASDPFIIDNYAQINLDDGDFLTYIKTQVIKQNFDGTRETLQKLYSTYVNGQIQKGMIDLRFLYMTENQEDGAVCTIRWDTENPSENLRLLFENGYLTIESLGVLYNRSIVNFNRIASYAKESYSILSMSSAPSDWATAEGKYFSVSDSGAATSSWDDSLTYAIRTENGWIVLGNQPTDWEGTYQNYRVVTITSAEGETYAPNSFFSLNKSDNSKYAKTTCVLLDTEPSGWARGGYYFESSETPTSTWDATKIYAKLVSSDYVVLPNQPSYWADLSDFSSYAILEKTDGSETFAQNTYYEAHSVGGLYV